jgi:lipopolysaccharide/colanic/teichoic acid biosynthesis glycosyltransferase
MVTDAEKIGAQVTVGYDPRITRSGRFLRKFRLDELPQLLNVLMGDMSFVGTRPEVPRYVEHYTPEMWATLLLPAGITSEASIQYKDEDRLLEGSDNPEDTYVKVILPEKMKYNLQYMENFRFFRDIGIMLRTVVAVLK